MTPSTTTARASGRASIALCLAVAVAAVATASQVAVAKAKAATATRHMEAARDGRTDVVTSASHRVVRESLGGCSRLRRVGGSALVAAIDQPPVILIVSGIE